MRRTMRASVLTGLLAAFTLPSPGAAASPLPTVSLVAPPIQAETASAEGIHDWNNLRRLRRDDRITVLTTRNRVLEGRFVGYTPEALSFTVEGEPVSIERARVAEVQWREKSHKVRNAVLTAGVSLLVGWVAGAGAEASSEPDQASQTASALSLEAGSATHDALPSHPVIYRAPGPPTE